MASYDYFIEARLSLEKGKLVQSMKGLAGLTGLKFQNIPHFTLVYNFEPRVNPSTIIETVRRVSLQYKNLKFVIDGFEIMPATNGHVFAFKINPSSDLAEFRHELYDNIKGMINERSDVKDHNTNKDFWFHATIAAKLQDREIKAIQDVVCRPSKNHWPWSKPQSGLDMRARPVTFPSEVILITLLNRGKISREYDRLADRILGRRQALSHITKRHTLKEFRKKQGIEVSDRTRPGQTWIMSDTHFDHENIIRYASRPFFDAEEMNQIIESNWNNTVHDGDRVYFLGDMAYGRGSRSKEYWLKRLNGNIEYIRGNHDTETGTVSHAVISHKGNDLLLVHDPGSLPIKWNGWVIHGDVHNNSLGEYPLVNARKKTVNVCAELIKYTPISLDKIIELIDVKADRMLL